MSLKEFSDEFDVLYDNASNSAPGLDAYEKSVFLTTAQEEIVLSYFSPKQNKPKEGFDDSEKRQMDFSSLIKTRTFTTKTWVTGKLKLEDGRDSIYLGAKKKALLKNIEDLLIIVNEFITVERGGTETTLTVVPITYKEYGRLMSKPFKSPKFYQAWRILDNDEEGSTAYLIAGPEDEITDYSIRYIKKPSPIIVGDIGDLSIDGFGKNEKPIPEKCEVDEILHREIIKRAVELAVAAYSSNAADKIQLGNLSQTDIGVQ